MRGPGSNDVVRIIQPGSHDDGLTLRELCERIGRQIVNANPNHTSHRVDLYREVEFDGRRFFVRVKFTVPFLSIISEKNE